MSVLQCEELHPELGARLMCSYEIPAEGGETMFVSTRSAYDRLPDQRKQQLDGLIAIHDYVYSRFKVAPDAVSPELGDVAHLMHVD